MKNTEPSVGRSIIWALVCALFLLHQDSWWWSDRSLVLGFLPIGLAYHAGFSLAAGLVWALACKFAWPDEIEAWAAEESEGASQRGGAA